MEILIMKSFSILAPLNKKQQQRIYESVRSKSSKWRNIFQDPAYRTLFSFVWGGGKYGYIVI